MSLILSSNYALYNNGCVRLKNYIHDLPFSPCSECCMLSSGNSPAYELMNKFKRRGIT